MVSETLEVIVEIPDVLRIRITADGTRTIEGQSVLQVLYYPAQEAVLIRHEDFIYSLNKDIPVFTNTRPSDCYMGKRYIVSLGTETKAFVFSKHVPQIDQANFEEIINQYAKLFFANDGNEPEWIGDTVYANEKVANEIHKSHFFNHSVKIEGKSETKKEDESVSKKIGTFLSLSGDVIMTGISKAGEFIGKGIRSGIL